MVKTDLGPGREVQKAEFLLKQMEESQEDVLEQGEPRYMRAEGLMHQIDELEKQLREKIHSLTLAEEKLQ